MMTYTELFKDVRPNWNVHPGEIIKEYLSYNGWTQKELAQRTSVSVKHINELIKGKKDISPDMADKLSDVFGTTVEFWNNLNSRYLEQKRYLEKIKALRTDKAWLKEFPATWMKNMGWVPKFEDVGQQVDAFLRFFGVTSVSGWRAILSNYTLKYKTAFRESKAFDRNPGAAFAWIRKAEIAANFVSDTILSQERLRMSLPELKKLTTVPEPSVFMPQVKKILDECGVKIVFIEAPPGCHAHAVTLWRDEHCIIANSGRYKSDDQFWFSLFHEIGHILLEHNRGTTNEEQEQLADIFAQNQLIPPEFSGEISTLKTQDDICRFAKRAGVSPGIVVGRLQHDKQLKFDSIHNKLKVRYPKEAFR